MRCGPVFLRCSLFRARVVSCCRHWLPSVVPRRSRRSCVLAVWRPFRHAHVNGGSGVRVMSRSSHDVQSDSEVLRLSSCLHLYNSTWSWD